MRTRHLLASGLVLLLAACGDKGTEVAASSTATPAKSVSAPAQAATPPPLSSEAAAPGTTEPEPAAEVGDIADLKQKALGVLGALKQGDAKRAADFCLGKHRDGLEKFISDALEKKDKGRAKAYRAWDGKLGEIRVDGERARVSFGKDDDSINYLSFRDKDGVWSLDDLPVTNKTQWAKWGKPVKEQ